MKSGIHQILKSMNLMKQICVYVHVTNEKTRKSSYTEVEPSVLLQDNSVFTTQFVQTLCSVLVFVELG